MSSHAEHSLRPILVDASTAEREGRAHYDANGDLLLRDERLPNGQVAVPADRQFPCILATFMALDKALTGQANSPHLRAGGNLREAFDAEFSRYLELVSRVRDRDGWEPGYGTYVYDVFEHKMYLVAPEYWHRLALVTSSAKLLTDPGGALTAEELRQKLEQAVIGFAGASVGSNLVEGAARELRCRRAKIADPDHLELTNLNRLERGSLRFAVQSRASRADRRNTFDVKHVNKASMVAYEQQLVDPYAQWYVYSDGIHGQNIDRFLDGDGDEPAVDVLVEEVDDLALKVELRRAARSRGIPVLMLSDFGHRAQAQFQDYRADRSGALGYRVGDAYLEECRERFAASGKRDDMFAFARALAGDDFAQDEFLAWVEQRGEQPTGSLPQSGATAMISGGWGGKLIALHVLGHSLPERLIFDGKRATLTP